MYRLRHIIHLLFLSVFVLISSGLKAQDILDIDSLRKDIAKSGFNGESFNYYSFYLENNSFDSNSEKFFLKKLTNSVERGYALAFIEYKEGDYNSAFERLVQLLYESPKKIKYFQLLSRTAGILNKFDHLITEGGNQNDSEVVNKLYAFLEYDLGNYDKSKLLFSSLKKKDPTSFLVNYSIAYCYRYLGKLDSAEIYLDQILSFPNLEKYNKAKVLIAKGSLQFISGNYEKAQKYYKKGLVLAIETDFNKEVIKGKLNLAMIDDLMGEIENARSLFNEAIKLSEEINDLELIALTKSELAVSYTYTNELVEARKIYLDCLEVFTLMNNKTRIAHTANNIGNLFLNVSNYRESLSYFKKALQNAGEDIHIKIESYRGLGDVYTNTSNYKKAFDYYHKADRMANEINDVAAQAKTDLGFGLLYYNLGQKDKAKNRLVNNLNKLKEDENPYLLVELYQKLGLVYFSMDSLYDAEKMLTKSISMSQDYGDIYNELLSNTFFAQLLIKKNKISSAKSILDNAMIASKEYEFNQLLGMQNLILSEIVSESRSRLKYLSNALEYSELAFDFETAAQSCYQIGNINYTMGEIETAERNYLMSIDYIEKLSNNLLSQADIQIPFFANYLSVYSELADLYLSRDKFMEAFLVLDKSRSRNSFLNVTQKELYKNKSEFNLNEFFDIEWKLMNDLVSQAEYDSLMQIMDEIFIKKDQSINKIEYDSLMNNNQFFVSVNRIGEEYGAFTISSKGITFKQINFSSDSLLKILSAISPVYDVELQDQNISFNRDLFAYNQLASSKFYQKFWQPILNELPKGSEIILSLPSKLANFPAEMLVINQNVRKGYLFNKLKFLVESYSISYSPSFHIWKKISNMKNTTTNAALLMGDPVFESDVENYTHRGSFLSDLSEANYSLNRLKYSKEEVENISDLIKNNTLFLSGEATESNFKKNSTNSDIIHLSSHSMLHNKNPIIFFTQHDPDNDGILEVGEIIDLDISSELIVLSSCKSGLGITTAGEGVLGMQKAFFDAGAKSIIVSQWDVDDRNTSKLMNYFYKYLTDGYSRTESLSKAKNTFISEVDPNPYYWAGFVLAGESGKLNIEKKSTINMIVHLFIICIIIFLPVMLMRKKTRKQF